MPELLADIFTRYKKPSPEELEHVIVEIKRLQKLHPDPKNQGYYDRVQRASSWLAKARRMVADPEAKFIFAWIALNALCGIRQDVLETDWWKNEKTFVPQLNKKQNGDRDPGELEWFLWRVCGLDVGGRMVRSVIEDHWHDVETVLMSHYVMSFYWNGSWPTEGDLDKCMRVGMKIVKAAIGLSSDKEKIHQALREIVIGRLRTLRNQLIHGCATDTHSKRRAAGESELEAGSRLLEEFVWAFLILMTGQSGQAKYWPPGPYPRAGSPQHGPLKISWLPK
jgi:hypothetical protein